MYVKLGIFSNKITQAFSPDDVGSVKKHQSDPQLKIKKTKTDVKIDKLLLIFYSVCMQKWTNTLELF